MLNDKNALYNLFEEICNRLRLEGEGHLEVSRIDLDENKRSLTTEIVFVIFRDLAPAGPDDHVRLALSSDLFDPTRFTSYKELKDNIYQMVKQYYYNWRNQQLAGASWASQSKAARTYAREDAEQTAAIAKLGALEDALSSRGALGAYINGMGAAVLKDQATIKVDLGTASHTSAPWDDPLSDMQDKANNTIACMDMNETKNPDGSFNLNRSPTIYYHNRFPSKHLNVIIDDAVEALKKYKGMNIKIISKNLFQDGWNITYGITKNYGPDVKQGILMEVILPKRIFDRTHHTIDNYAKLRNKWDTDTYIALRIAYVLGNAAKLNESDARGYKSDILKIINKVTKPIFTF